MHEGYYYLHVNGDLIFKPELGTTVADIRESDLAVGLWSIDISNRENAWSILVEGLAAGANIERIVELANKWGADDKDAAIYADRVGVNIYMDGVQWCATRKDFINLQESPAGFGDTSLIAMAELCKALGYKPTKIWPTTFADLLKQDLAA